MNLLVIILSEKTASFIPCLQGMRRPDDLLFHEVKVERTDSARQVLHGKESRDKKTS